MNKDQEILIVEKSTQFDSAPSVSANLKKVVTDTCIWPFLELRISELYDESFSSTIRFNNISVEDLLNLGKLFNDLADQLKVAQQQIDSDNEILRKAEELIKEKV